MTNDRQRHGTARGAGRPPACGAGDGGMGARGWVVKRKRCKHQSGTYYEFYKGEHYHEFKDGKLVESWEDAHDELMNEIMFKCSVCGCEFRYPSRASAPKWMQAHRERVEQ